VLVSFFDKRFENSVRIWAEKDKNKLQMASSTVRLIVMIAFASYSSVNGFALTMPVLYTGQEPGLTIIDSKSLNRTMFNQSHAIVFEFYNSWCGHCARFAPVWKQFAGEVRHWSSAVRVVALDCALDDNTPICRQYEVEMYPSVRLFAPQVAGLNDHGHQVEELKPKADFFLNITTKYLIEYQAKNETTDWPHLQPLTSISNWQTVQTKLNHDFKSIADLEVFLYIEPFDSLNGSQVRFEIHV
jgi:thiol-disulfide isomerase/thioredoxin